MKFQIVKNDERVAKDIPFTQIQSIAVTAT